MSKNRTGRGPHPGDAELFGSGAIAQLRNAAGDYLWLLNRGYASASSLKLVGDRFNLARRQRQAVARVVCSDEEQLSRRKKQLGNEEVRGRVLTIDGFNVMVTLEAALGGGVILDSRDGCLRDMSSMHGTYRRTDASIQALQSIGKTLEATGVEQCHWYFDRPVSNSGRVVESVRSVAQQNGWNWDAETANDPDDVLVHTQHVMVTADSAVIDRGGEWLNLVRTVVEDHVSDAWILDICD